MRATERGAAPFWPCSIPRGPGTAGPDGPDGPPCFPRRPPCFPDREPRAGRMDRLARRHRQALVSFVRPAPGHAPRPLRPRGLRRLPPRRRAPRHDRSVRLWAVASRRPAARSLVPWFPSAVSRSSGGARAPKPALRHAVLAPRPHGPRHARWEPGIAATQGGGSRGGGRLPCRPGGARAVDSMRSSSVARPAPAPPSGLLPLLPTASTARAPSPNHCTTPSAVAASLFTTPSAVAAGMCTTHVHHVVAASMCSSQPAGPCPGAHLPPDRAAASAARATGVRRSLRVLLTHLPFAPAARPLLTATPVRAALVKAAIARDAHPPRTQRTP